MPAYSEGTIAAAIRNMGALPSPCAQDCTIEYIVEVIPDGKLDDERVDTGICWLGTGALVALPVGVGSAVVCKLVEVGKVAGDALPAV